MRIRRSSTPAVLILSLLALACGARDEAPDPSPANAGTLAPAPAQQASPPLVVTPAGGRPGTEVRLTMSNLVMNGAVELGFGGMAEHVILTTGKADANGTWATTVTIPAATARGVAYFFVADPATSSPISRPVPFLVAAANGAVRVTARISDEGVECTAARGEAGELYTLTGVDDYQEVGASVVIEGTIAEVSTCQQGLTIAVTSLRAVP